MLRGAVLSVCVCVCGMHENINSESKKQQQRINYENFSNDTENNQPSLNVEIYFCETVNEITHTRRKKNWMWMQWWKQKATAKDNAVPPPLLTKMEIQMLLFYETIFRFL